jgi:hypothetical protein
MAKEAGGHRPRTTLYWQLRTLATNRGIWREDLREKLNNELRDLRDHWELDTGQSQGLDDIRKSVGRILLQRHRPKIPPQSGRRKKWLGQPRASFEHVFKFVFNALDEDAGVLEARLVNSGVSKTAAQRDLDYACEQIERQILATGFVPQMPVPDVQDDPQDVDVEPPHEPRKVHKPEIIARELVSRSPRTMTVRRVDVLDPLVVEPAGPARRLWRVPRRYKIAVIIAVFVLLGGGVAVFQLLPGSTAQETRSTENPLGDALAINLQEVRSHNLVSGIAFAEDHQGDGQRLLALAETGGITPESYNDALESGAYLVGGATLSLKLSTKQAGQSVDLFKARVIKNDLPLATYMAFRSVGLDWSSQGASETFAEEAGVLLDAGTEAHEVDSSGNLLGPYLQRRRVPVSDLASPQLILYIEARERAYEFQVELEYVMNGRPFSQLVNFQGQQFRVTADLCITHALSYKLSAPVIDTLSRLRYTVVALPDKRTGATPGTYTTEQSDSFAEACRRQ